MIKEFTGYTVYPDSSTIPNNTVDPRDRHPEALQSLTLSPRGVLVARVPKHTDVDTIEAIRNYLKECFPNNRVVVLWENISLSVIEDESYRERMCPEHDSSNYY